MDDLDGAATAADEDLRAAIIRHAVAHEVDDSADLLLDFVVIAAWIPVDTEVASTRYSVHIPSGTPSHVTLGLMGIGEQYVLADGEIEDD